MSDPSITLTTVPRSLTDALALDALTGRRLGAALTAVDAAGRVCRRIQQRSCAGAHAKHDASPVTLADYASQAIVVYTLRRLLGTANLVAEEEAAMVSSLGGAYLETLAEVLQEVWPDATPSAVREAIEGGAGTPARSGFWTLDPVDGTKGFLRNQQYAIALACIDDGRPTLAVLGCPRLSPDPSVDPGAADDAGVICFAVEGRGAWERPLGAPADVPRPLENGAPSGTLRVCASVERVHGNASGLASIIEHVGVAPQTVRLDSQAKYAVVARRQADAYLRVPGAPDYVEWIWDHAAGSLIATEAGGRVTDLCGRPLDFSRGRRLHANDGILCASPAWHGRLLDAARAAGLATRRS